MVTLLAVKAKELRATEDKEGTYTIATHIDVKGGIKDSLLSN